MATTRQALGNFGEVLISKTVSCPRCKHSERTLRMMPTNFKCADIICDFCGFLAQVKTATVANADLSHPPKILGAAWGPQQARMQAGIYFSLYVVVVSKSDSRNFAVYFLPSELQTAEMFVPRKPLSSTARRAGWQGYMIDIDKALGTPVRIT